MDEVSRDGGRRGPSLVLVAAETARRGVPSSAEQRGAESQERPARTREKCRRRRSSSSSSSSSRAQHSAAHYNSNMEANPRSLIQLPPSPPPDELGPAGAGALLTTRTAQPARRQLSSHSSCPARVILATETPLTRGKGQRSCDRLLQSASLRRAARGLLALLAWPGRDP